MDRNVCASQNATGCRGETAGRGLFLAAFDGILTEPDFARDGFDIVTDESPEAFRKVIQSDIEKWSKVIKAAGIPQQ